MQLRSHTKLLRVMQVGPAVPASVHAHNGLGCMHQPLRHALSVLQPGLQQGCVAASSSGRLIAQPQQALPLWSGMCLAVA